MSMKFEPRPFEVKALQNFLIYVKFKNGEEKIYEYNIKALDTDDREI